jgi:hypothetical protein
MAQKIKFTKQHKPVGFGDGPDPAPLRVIATLWKRLLRRGVTTGG